LVSLCYLGFVKREEEVPPCPRGKRGWINVTRKEGDRSTHLMLGKRKKAAQGWESVKREKVKPELWFAKGEIPPRETDPVVAGVYVNEETTFTKRKRPPRENHEHPCATKGRVRFAVWLQSPRTVGPPEAWQESTLPGKGGGTLSKKKGYRLTVVKEKSPFIKEGVKKNDRHPGRGQ